MHSTITSEIRGTFRSAIILSFVCRGWGGGGGGGGGGGEEVEYVLPNERDCPLPAFRLINPLCGQVWLLGLR